MTSQVVKVRSENLSAWMTCPLCFKLLREATTISLCLHTWLSNLLLLFITIGKNSLYPLVVNGWSNLSPYSSSISKQPHMGLD
ncbi:hypothetical protein CsSME_00023577 [Camellia sinensis var. sinensis]